MPWFGNPPYVRQELIPKRNENPKPKHDTAKEDLFELCKSLWGVGTHRSGVIYIAYFWLASTDLFERRWLVWFSRFVELAGCRRCMALPYRNVGFEEFQRYMQFWKAMLSRGLKTPA